MKNLQQKIKSGKLNVNEDDPFELFVASTNIRYCYYSESHKILGQTFGMLILQVKKYLFGNCTPIPVYSVTTVCSFCHF